MFDTNCFNWSYILEGISRIFNTKESKYRVIFLVLYLHIIAYCQLVFYWLRTRNKKKSTK